MYGSDETFDQEEKQTTAAPQKNEAGTIADDEQPQSPHSADKIVAEPTIGEKRVRTSFNPGNNDTVQNLKEYFARGINRVEALKSFKVPGDGPTTDPEKLRLISLAQTKLEEAAMYAVKAATF